MMRVTIVRYSERILHDHCAIDTRSVLSYLQVTITGLRVSSIHCSRRLIDLDVLFPTEPA
jgi:hypothetical protein